MKQAAAEKPAYVRDHRPDGLSVTEGFRQLCKPRSSFYRSVTCPYANGPATGPMHGAPMPVSKFSARPS